MANNEGKQDLEELEKNVHKLEAKGLSKEKVIKKLIDAGWPDHVVELIVYEAHRPQHSLENLKKYVDKQLLKAKSKEEVKEELLDMGLDEEIIDSALGFKPVETKKKEPMVED